MLSAYFLLALSLLSVTNAAESAVSQSERKTSLGDVVQKPIRLILTDVDGTLADVRGNFFNPNDRAIRLAQLLGIEVAFATGRPKDTTLEMIGDTKLRTMGYYGNPGVYLNGSYVLGRDGEVLRDEPLKEELVERMLKIFEEEGVLDKACAVCLGGLFYYKDHENVKEPVYKMHFEGDPPIVSKMRQRLEVELGDAVAFRQSHQYSFQVVTRGYDKGEGLRLLCEYLGISPDEVLAMGNALDDLPMFALAGTSVAVGDAYDVVKAAADHVTIDHTKGALFEVMREIIAHELFPKPGSTNAEN